MIGVILAAGAGTRLGQLTTDLPKTLLPVDDNRTIFDVLVANLSGNGIDEIVAVVGHAAARLAEQVDRLEEQHGCKLTLVENEKAAVWNNAYSLWTARNHLGEGAMVVNGDTLHPGSVESTMLNAGRPDAVLLAADLSKQLGEEEMKVLADERGQLTHISKLIEPGTATGEFIGVSLVGTDMADALVDALRVTWEHNPHEYYEMGFQRLADAHQPVRIVPLEPGTPWVEVDTAADLDCAREIACLC